jgi:hypothetical protein
MKKQSPEHIKKHTIKLLKTMDRHIIMSFIQNTSM